MDRAITIGDVLMFYGIAVGAIVIIGGLLALLAAYGRGMSR